MSGSHIDTPCKSLEKAQALAAELSIEEQVSLLTGSDFWRTKAIPDRSIPSIKTTDGPNGARGEHFANGTPAALFPCGASLAATWNTALIRKVGRALGQETKRRGANVLLAPTVCLHRHPLGGRNFESFSEDPYLTGKLAAAYIDSVQSEGVAATIKHFVGNEQETDRTKANSIISERALRELYLKPFEIAIREARPMAVMTAYNALNGVHCDQHTFLLKHILRGEWKFDGLVMSDWGALSSGLPSLLAGCDLEMPHSAKWRGDRLLQEIETLNERANLYAWKKRCAQIVPAMVTDAVRDSATRVLCLIERARGLQHPGRLEPEPDEHSVEDFQTDELIRKSGAEGIVLLKNEGNLLPIRNCKTLAVIGPNANRAVANGGGSASLTPLHTVTPLEGLKSHTDVSVQFAQGCDSWKWVPLASDYCTTSDGEPGVMLEYFRGPNPEGRPIQRVQQTSTDLYLWDSPPAELRDEVYAFRVTTRITPKTTGAHTLGFSSVGPGRLLLSGELMIDNWNWTRQGEAMFGNSAEVIREIQMEANIPVELIAESTNELRPRAALSCSNTNHGYGGCRIGFFEERTTDLLQEAVDLAKSADIAVVVVGLDAEWESEGYDRKDMHLPKDGTQDRLIEAVARANPRTVVVNQSGGPVSMPWVDKVPSILQTWYQGQEAGHSLADVLFGVESPSGRLPMTFPRRLKDTPAHGNWAPENNVVEYKEGIFMGYRHYDRTQIRPLFSFGHGMSYTTFAYGMPTINKTTMGREDVVNVTVFVQNIGSVAGAEVVQAYVRDREASAPRPSKELKAFTKVFLRPGDCRSVCLEFDKHAVGFYDGRKKMWLAEKGTFDILLGGSSGDIRQAAPAYSHEILRANNNCRRTISFEVQESFTWVF